MNRLQCAPLHILIFYRENYFSGFEQAIADLEARIEELRFVQDDSAVDISEEIARLEAKRQDLDKSL